MHYISFNLQSSQNWFRKSKPANLRFAAWKNSNFSRYETKSFVNVKIKNFDSLQKSLIFTHEKFHFSAPKTKFSRAPKIHRIFERFPSSSQKSSNFCVVQKNAEHFSSTSIMIVQIPKIYILKYISWFNIY